MADVPGLHWADWIVFGAMIVASLAIGLYHSGRQRSTSEYLMGDRNIHVIPAAMSLTVSFISSILILGEPAEMYTFGAQFWLSKWGWILGAILSTLIFVPVLHPLKLTSVNKYIEMRYKSKVPRTILSLYSVVSTIFYAAIVSFGQAIAIEAVTGFPTWATILIGNIAALVYTTLGGLRGVIWTDVFQSLIMVVGLLAVVIQGFISVGGFTRMFELNAEWGRLDMFDFDPDPTKRMNFYGCIFGSALSWMSVYGHLQTGFQRYAAMPTLRKAKQVVLLTIPGSFFLGTLASLAGLCIFAHFANIGCDPLADGTIRNPNQIGPYFVVTTLNYPGVCGLYFACIAAGCLSTISSVLNAAAGQVWDDLIKPYWNISDRNATILTKIIVLLGGVLTVLLSICVSQLGGNIIQMIGTFGSALGGPMAGLFVMGFFLPWANWKGASVGCLFGTAFSLWIGFGSYSIERHLGVLPTTTENCPNSEMNVFNTTEQFSTSNYNVAPSTASVEEHTLNGIERLYALSFLWMKEVATVITIAVSMIVSLATGLTDPKTVDPGCLHPWVRKYFAKDCMDVKISESQKADEILKLRDFKETEEQINDTNGDIPYSDSYSCEKISVT